MRTEEIKDWFRAHECLNAYYRAAYLHNRRRYPNSIWSSFDNAVRDYRNNMINKVIYWEGSLEGHSFWRDLNNEFVEWWQEGEGHHIN